MTTTVTKCYCDICGKEMNKYDSIGSLKLSYSEKDWAGNGAPAGLKYDEICLDCCRKLHNIIYDTVKQIKEENK